VRVGWCIEHDDLDGLRTALRLTHTLWGGRFNPIIPVGNPGLARSGFGELVQWDTSEHDWLEGRGPVRYLMCGRIP
jgi:hypothetical protein